MLQFLRTTFLFLCAGGGAWGAWQGLGILVQKVGGARDLHLTSEAVLLVIPVCIAGALLGALIGGILLPRPSN